MREQVINFVTMLGILGIPTIFSMTIWCIKACKKFADQLTILMESQQAQMRSSLLKDYKRYYKQGYIELDDLDDWESSYQKYHMLGANGVLDAKRDELFKLPSMPPPDGAQND